MRLLNPGFLGLLAAIALFGSGCHSMNWHALCYHGSTAGYFPPSAPAAPYSYHTHSNSRHWGSPRAARARSGHDRHGDHDKSDKD